jgi:hypothetical protein
MALVARGHGQAAGEADEFFSDLLLSVFGGSNTNLAFTCTGTHQFAALVVGEDGVVTVTSGRDASDVVTRIIIAGQPGVSIGVCFAFLFNNIHGHQLQNSFHAPTIPIFWLQSQIFPQNTFSMLSGPHFALTATPPLKSFCEAA